MTNNRIKEAEEAALAAGHIPSLKRLDTTEMYAYNTFLSGYLAACEKCEGEMVRFAEWCSANDFEYAPLMNEWYLMGSPKYLSESFTTQQLLEQFKTQSHESGNIPNE